MDDTNWGNQPQYHGQQPDGHCDDTAPTIPGQPGLTSHFAKGRGNALRWTAGIIAAVVLAGGGAIVGMDLLGGGSSSTGSSVGAPPPAGSSSAGSGGLGAGGNGASGPSGGGQAAALSALLSSAGLAGSGSSGTASADGPARHLGRALRLLRGVHGEFTVRKRGGGFAQIAFERGTVVSTSGTSLVVRAADGTTWTWTLTSDTVVRKDRAKSSASALSAGDLVFAAGTENGSVRDARLVIARDKQAGGSQGSSSSSTSQN